MENEIQYGQMNFNLPHDVVPLPSQGLFYANKKKSVKVGYLTAQDENLLASVNMGTTNVIAQLLKSKIYEPDVRIDDLLPGDVEAILIFLRNTAFGPKYKISSIDPQTSKRFECEIELSELNIKQTESKPSVDGYFETKLPMSDDVVKLRLLTYGEESLIDSELDLYPDGMIAPKVTRKLESYIVSINGSSDREQIVKYIQMMPIRDSQFIRRFVNDSEPRLDLKKQVIAPSGERVDTSVSFGVEFFRPFFGV
jgi:hypothetical protein